MDDDEVLAEGNPLTDHLRRIGFMDLYSEASKPVRQTLCLDRKKTKGGTIDCDVIEEVLALRAANLLFEEDLDHVDCIFANFDLAKNESYKFMFKGKASAFVLALGLCCYMYIGSYAFVLVSIFYAYRTSEYLWKKHTRLKRLKRLMTVIQSNFSLFVRVLKFVYENEHILRNRFGANSSHRAFNVLSKLKTDFVGLQQEINDVLAGATLTLIDRVPLCDYVENPSCYLCQNSDYYKVNKLTQLHNIYMLLQSQFLTRLIFSLVPNLLAKQDETYDAITDVVGKVTFRLHDVQRLLNKKFKFVLTNGLFVDDTKSARQLPSRARRAALSTESVVNNIHELSNSLQFSLIKCRELENTIHSGGSPNLELDLGEIQKELSSCLAHVDDILLINSKQKHVKGDVDVIPEEKIVGEAVRVTELGYPDLNPDVGDDIFEGSTDNVQEDTQNSTYDYEEEVELLAKRQQKHVLVELKSRLKQQAEDWARREALVCARKGLTPMEQSTEIIRDSDYGYDDESQNRRFKAKYQRAVKRSKYRNRNEDYGQNEIEAHSSRNRYDSEKNRSISQQTSLFAQSIRQTHGKVGPALTEESYCGSGENSNTDDD